MADNLAHYGVKGMKWGRRKSDSSSSSQTSRRGPVSEDAANARRIAAKVKKTGTKSLSNKEIQELSTRMNLEANLGRLRGQKSFMSRVKNGNELAKTVLAVGATVNAAVAFSQSPAGKRVISSLTTPSKKQQTLNNIAAMTVKKAT
jgi:hypothetical protein